MKDKNLALQIAKKVNEIGGTAYFVGGCVIDSVLGIIMIETERKK